jgi:hypothetical protein
VAASGTAQIAPVLGSASAVEQKYLGLKPKQKTIVPKKDRVPLLFHSMPNVCTNIPHGGEKMTSKLFLELAFVGLLFGTLVVVSKLRIAEVMSVLDALRADIKMTLLEIDNEIKLDPTDPDFSAGRATGLRQAQRMLKAVLERDTRREKYGD